MTVRILIDPVACDAYGYCAELLPEAITLDEWGYPIVDGKPLPAELVEIAKRAAAIAHGAPSACASAREAIESGTGRPVLSLVNERAAPRPVPEGLVIRRATEADLTRVVELLSLGAVPGTPERERDADPEAYRDAFREIDHAGGAVLVGELEGDVVGVAQLIVFRHLQAGGGRCAEIESVHVHPDYRGSGVGAAVMRHAIERARALGCYRVQLTSNVVREDAHRFYESLGFVPSHVGFKRSLD